jgi:hypothetical protein
MPPSCLIHERRRRGVPGGVLGRMINSHSGSGVTAASIGLRLLREGQMNHVGAHDLLQDGPRQ